MSLALILVMDVWTSTIDPALLDKHIAIDIGAAPLTEELAARLKAPAILATVSRLVIDLHREPDHPGLIPLASDGYAVPGNESADRADRIARFHTPYHQALAQLNAQRPSIAITQADNTASALTADAQLAQAKAAFAASSHDLAGARAKLADAEATRTRDQAQFQRYEQLFQAGTISRQDYDRAQAAARSADATVAR